MNTNSDLIKLLISILIIILIYNYINLSKRKSIEGFETMTTDDITLYEQGVNELGDRINNENTVQKLAARMKRKDLYGDENYRLIINHSVKLFYLGLFNNRDSSFSLDGLKNNVNKETYSLMGWIRDTNDSLLFKILTDVFLPIKDINDDKLLFKKLVNELSNEIGLNDNNDNNDNDKTKDMEKMERIIDKTEEMLDISNIVVSELFLDADISNSYMDENLNICLKHMNDTKKLITFNDYIYLLKKNPILDAYIKKLLKNAKKTTEYINDSTYKSDKTFSEIQAINEKNRKEHKKDKSSNKPDTYEKIDVLTGGFVEKTDFGFYSHNVYINMLLHAHLIFKKIFNEVKKIDNEYKVILEEKLTTNAMVPVPDKKKKSSFSLF
mgnify:CR=1 FL=1|tara:strand:+ start:3247 stop:4392 length:1146 start_codon:yes stop_codon:yes gene_type:complete